MTANDTPAGPPTGQTYDEAAAAEYIGRLLRDEQAGARIDFSIGPYSLILMIGAIQMVIRSSNAGELISGTLRALVAQWRTAFDGTPGEQYIDMGFNPAYDGDGTPGNSADPTGKWWSCTRCQVHYDATAFKRVYTCANCGGPMTLTTGDPHSAL